MNLIPHQRVSCFITIISLIFYFTIAINHHSQNTNSIKNNNNNLSPSFSHSFNSLIKTIDCYIHNCGDYNNNNEYSNNNNNIIINIGLDPKEEIMSGKTTVKLLTYNVFIRPPGIKNNIDDYKDERIECLISDNLSPHINNNKTPSPHGISNSVYSIDKTQFPYIPYLSPWKYPIYNKLIGKKQEEEKISPDNKLKQQNIHNNSKDYQPITPSKSILGQYDIICLQELFSAFSYRQRRFLEKAETQGFKYIASSPSPPYLRSTFLVDGGLSVISKYPIVQSDFLLYKQGVDSDMLASKGVLYTKIKLAGSSTGKIDRDDDQNYIHLFTTHMQASYAPKSDGSKEVKATAAQDSATNYKNDNIRLIQLNQLREFIINKTYRDKSKIILAGDLNVNGRISKDNDRDSESYLQMLELLSTVNKDLPNSIFEVGKKVFSIQDLLKDDYNGSHPPTVGDIKVVKDSESSSEKEVPLETVLTNPNDYGCMKRLDYILIFNREFELSSDGVDEINKLNSPNTSENKKQQHSVITPLKGSTKVEPFFIQGFPFTQLSDHYGVSTTLQINKQQTNK